MSIICIKHKNGTYPFFDDKYFSTFFSKCQCFFSATIKFFYARKVLNLLTKALQRLLRGSMTFLTVCREYSIQKKSP